MPDRSTSSSRERPFQDKKVLLFLGDGKDQPSEERWALILRMGGAKATTLDDSCNTGGGGGGRGGGGEVRNTERGSAAAEGAYDRRCNTETALALLRKGDFHYLIGPEASGISDRAMETREKLRAAALRAGVTSGTPEWAAQCIMHGRPLVPGAGTCSWFPLEAAVDRGTCDFASGGAVGGAAAEGAPPSRAGRGKGKKGGGRARGGGCGRGRCAADRRGARNAGRGGGGGGGGSKKDVFHVHSAGGRRLVAGDYAFLKGPTGIATSDKGTPAAPAPAGRGNRTAGAARSTTGGGRSTGGGGVATADAGGTSRLRVARVLSFERGLHDEVEALVTVMEPHIDGRKLLVAGGEERVRHEALGARVLVMETEEMNSSQIYSIPDVGVFCLVDKTDGGGGAGRVSVVRDVRPPS